MSRALRLTTCVLWISVCVLAVAVQAAALEPLPGAVSDETVTPGPETISTGAVLTRLDAPVPQAVGASAGLTRGWPVDLGFDGGGYPYTPTLADVNGDGALEVFLVGENCFGLWGDGTFIPGWPTREQTYQGYASNGNFPGPSIADIDRDGSQEIAWSTRDWYAGSSRIWTFNAKNTDGTNQPGFPQEAPDQSSNAMNSPLVLGDIDGDGDLESWTAHTLGNTGEYQRLTAVDHLGARLFMRDFGATELIHAPYFGDVDGDGTREIFAVTFRSSLPAAFRLHALYPDGTEKPGFPTNLAAVNTGWLTEGVPVPADLDGDGDLEIFLAHYTSTASFVRCVHHDGTSLPGFPLQVNTTSQIFYLSLGDLTGDGRPELLVMDKRIVVGGEYRAYAYDLAHGNALLPGWPVVLAAWPKGIPIVVDVDNDGSKDVVIGIETGQVVAFAASGAMIAGFPKIMASASFSGVSAGDIDGDGLFELVAASTDGWAYAWDTEGEALPGRADWPMRGVNAQNHGVYGVVQDPAEAPAYALSGRASLRVLGRPNPFTSSTAVRFALPEPAVVVLRVLDPAGRVIRILAAGDRNAGEHEITWDGRAENGRRVAAGTYLLSLRAGEAVTQGRLTLIR